MAPSYKNKAKAASTKQTTHKKADIIGFMRQNEKLVR
jgi:hypothetical protein